MSLRIDRITLTHVRIPLVEPFRISNGEVTKKDGIVVAVASDGLVGYGESSPMAGSFYSTDTPESCWAQLTTNLAPRAIGRDFPTLEDACVWLDGLPGGNFAKVGIETALWDLEAQRRRLPLHKLLGGELERVASGLAVGLYDTMDALLGAIERYLPHGYQRLKIKISPGQDVDLVTAVRERFGEIPLMTDANAAYTLQHLDVFRKLDEYNLLMYEQPLGRAMLGESAMLQQVVRTPVCLDESLETLADVERAAALRSFRVANIKIQRVGGFRNALRVYETCRRLGLSIWIGTMPELGIGQAQGAALASLPGCDFPTDVEASARWFVDDIIEPWIEVQGGWIEMPKAPGIGYRVDPEKLSRYRIANQEIA